MGKFWDGPAVLAVMSFSTALDAGVSARTCGDHEPPEATNNGTGAAGPEPAAGTGVRRNSFTSLSTLPVFRTHQGSKQAMPAKIVRMLRFDEVRVLARAQKSSVLQYKCTKSQKNS